VLCAEQLYEPKQKTPKAEELKVSLTGKMNLTTTAIHFIIHS
jgi:hypothetical protein